MALTTYHTHELDSAAVAADNVTMKMYWQSVNSLLNFNLTNL